MEREITNLHNDIEAVLVSMADERQAAQADEIENDRNKILIYE